MDVLVICPSWQEFHAKTVLYPRRRYSGCESSRLVLESRSSIDLFHQPHFVWEQDYSSQRPGPTQIPGKCVRIVRDSLDHGRREVDRLADALPDFLEPRSWISAVNHAPQNALSLGCIIAVSPDVVLRDLGVQREKAIHAPGLGEHVSRVSELWGFDDDGFLNVEDVFVPKQIDSACPACELAIEERIVIRAPADLGDIKVSRNTQFRTHSLKLGSLDRPMLQAQPGLVQSPRILAEAMIGSFGRFDLQMEIGRQFDLQPARQRSFPGNELPLLTALAVLAALYERALDLDLCSQQMLPLVPGTVPECMQDCWIEPELQLSTHVAAECPVIVEITSAQRHMHPPAPEIG